MKRITALALAFAVVAMPLLQAQPDTAQVDAALDKLLTLEPGALKTRLDAMKGEADAKELEALTLRLDAEDLDEEAKDLEAQLARLTDHVKALTKALGLEPKGPDPAMVAMQQAVQAGGVNFADHVRPIFQSKCLRCHDEASRRGGLSLATYAAIMEGGSSGPSIEKGNPDGSRLFRVIARLEEPYMPPSGDPMPQGELDLIRKWIELGAPQNAGDKTAAAQQKPAMKDMPKFVAASFNRENPPMPEVELARPQGAQQPGVAARAMDTSAIAPLMAVGADMQVLLYHTGNFELLGALPFPEGDIYSLSFSVNGELLVAGGGEEGDHGAVVVWNVRTGERLREFTSFYDTVLAADLSPDHKLIAAGGPNRRVTTFLADTGEEFYTLDAHTDWIYAVKFTPDGEVLVTADRGGGMYLWQAANGRQVEQLRGHEGAIHALGYTDDSVYLASAGADGTVQIWDTWAFKRVRQFQASGQAVQHLEFGPGNQLVTTDVNGVTKLWNLEGKEVKAFPKLADWGYQARFANEGAMVLAGSWDGRIVAWDTESAEQVAVLATSPAMVEKPGGAAGESET